MQTILGSPGLDINPAVSKAYHHAKYVGKVKKNNRLICKPLYNGVNENYMVRSIGHTVEMQKITRL
jgi:hypothetical protein